MDGATYLGADEQLEVVLDIRARAAIAAMQGLLAGEIAMIEAMRDESRTLAHGLRSPEETAKLAVRHADALIEALS